MSEPPDLAQALLNPENYPDSPHTIDFLQTVTSYVFLTGDYAYKIKKPVDPGYLDYTTLEKRRFYCNREITLNKRLCPDIYLDSVSISEDKHGISVEGKGKTIEYAVKMKQMPRRKMLDQLIQTDNVPENAMHRIAEKLTEFHSQSATSYIISNYGDIEFILTDTEDNFINTIRYISKTISQKSYRNIKDYTNAFLENNPSLFYERIAEDRVRDCHGAIRAEHICINETIHIFDCIEFNDSLRYIDVAADLANLAVDLDYLDRTDLSDEVVKAYTTISDDEDLPEIINFYKCLKAYQAGKLESMKLENAGISEQDIDSITKKAGRYFELAESYI